MRLVLQGLPPDSVKDKLHLVLPMPAVGEGIFAAHLPQSAGAEPELCAGVPAYCRGWLRGHAGAPGGAFPPLPVHRLLKLLRTLVAQIAAAVSVPASSSSSASSSPVAPPSIALLCDDVQALAALCESDADGLTLARGLASLGSYRSAGSAGLTSTASGSAVAASAGASPHAAVATGGASLYAPSAAPDSNAVAAAPSGSAFRFAAEAPLLAGGIAVPASGAASSRRASLTDAPMTGRPTSPATGSAPSGAGGSPARAAAVDAGAASKRSSPAAVPGAGGAAGRPPSARASPLTLPAGPTGRVSPALVPASPVSLFAAAAAVAAPTSARRSSLASSSSSSSASVTAMPALGSERGVAAAHTARSRSGSAASADGAASVSTARSTAGTAASAGPCLTPVGCEGVAVSVMLRVCPDADCALGGPLHTPVSLVNAVLALCDTVARFSPLPTGHSRDVSGRLVVSHKAVVAVLPTWGSSGKVPASPTGHSVGAAATAVARLATALASLTPTHALPASVAAPGLLAQHQWVTAPPMACLYRVHESSCKLLAAGEVAFVKAAEVA
jgi:hypothetical protein